MLRFICSSVSHIVLTGLIAAPAVSQACVVAHVGGIVYQASPTRIGHADIYDTARIGFRVIRYICAGGVVVEAVREIGRRDRKGLSRGGLWRDGLADWKDWPC